MPLHAHSPGSPSSRSTTRPRLRERFHPHDPARGRPRSIVAATTRSLGQVVQGGDPDRSPDRLDCNAATQIAHSTRAGSLSTVRSGGVAVLGPAEDDLANVVRPIGPEDRGQVRRLAFAPIQTSGQAIAHKPSAGGSR